MSTCLDDRLRHLLDRSTRDIIVSPSAARAAVRNRLRRLRQRRQRLRHTLGSSTLAAGALAGGWQLRDGTSLPSGEGLPAAAEPEQHVTPSPPRPFPQQPAGQPAAPPQPEAGPEPSPVGPLRPAASWTWDPEEGIDRVAADPSGIYAGGRFHVYTTSANHCGAGWCEPAWVPRFISDDLTPPGRLDGDAMPHRPAWVAADDRTIWAPSVAEIDDRYVMYFAATSGRSQDGGMKCLGTAVAPTPEGPFLPHPEPLHCTPGYWTIDPYPVATTDGGWTLLWRQDAAAHVTGRIVAAPLSPDGLELAAGSATQPDRHAPTTLLVGAYPWEDGYPDGGRGGIGPIENPAMTRHPVTGEWLLTWSANRWETQIYATGLARCEGPLGPCHRISHDAPWLRTSRDSSISTSATFGGAGGLSFVTGPDDQLLVVFHAYQGDGQSPAPRVGWAYRVEVDSHRRYRLVEIGGNL